MHAISIGNAELEHLIQPWYTGTALNLFLTSMVFAGSMGILHESLNQGISICFYYIISFMFVILECEGGSNGTVIKNLTHGSMETKGLGEHYMSELVN